MCGLKFFQCFIASALLLVTCLCQTSDPRSDSGYAQGYLSDCVGSDRPTTIPESEMKYLTFWVKGHGKSWKKYPHKTAGNMIKHINTKRKTMLIVLGYLDSVNFFITPTLGNEYEKLGYNIITVDFQRFVTIHYYISSRLMRPIGKIIAEVLVQLTQAGLDPKKLEMIGLSLGGHTVSYIGKNYQQLTGRNVSKIISLDPAGPCFRNLGPEDRLAPTDADFVEVLHMNIDGYGMATRMGHIDWYVNGGEFQPGDLYSFPCSSLCSHIMQLPIWLGSIKNPDKFIGLKCDSVQQARDNKCYERVPRETNLLGPKVNQSNQGIFYLATTYKFPFYLAEKGLDPKYSAWRQYAELNTHDYQKFYTG